MSMPPLVRWEYDYQPEPGTSRGGAERVYSGARLAVTAGWRLATRQRRRFAHTHWRRRWCSVIDGFSANSC